MFLLVWLLLQMFEIPIVQQARPSNLITKVNAIIAWFDKYRDGKKIIN